ncbi:hypothetical protein BK668_22955 [Pseudomonas fluorescens]|nr:hypothetical protein BK668_22955 [Pseudomonas fluorescens]
MASAATVGGRHASEQSTQFIRIPRIPLSTILIVQLVFVSTLFARLNMKIHGGYQRVTIPGSMKNRRRSRHQGFIDISRRSDFGVSAKAGLFIIVCHESALG